MVFKNDSFAYPIYGYTHESELSLVTIDVHYEIHTLLNCASVGSCLDIVCGNCPIENECSNGLSIYHFFPEIAKDHPELLI